MAGKAKPKKAAKPVPSAPVAKKKAKAKGRSNGCSSKKARSRSAKSKSRKRPCYGKTRGSRRS